MALLRSAGQHFPGGPLMNEALPFVDDGPPRRMDEEGFRLDLEGYEGPIDVLLQLARDQKVDLTRLSILALAEQYLEFIRQARHLRLELAADYLVMAAWLAYLKSRLLLPEPEGDEEPSGAELAAALKFQLQRLQAMQDAGVRLMARPRLGREIRARGAPEPRQWQNHGDQNTTSFFQHPPYPASGSPPWQTVRLIGWTGHHKDSTMPRRCGRHFAADRGLRQPQ